MSARPNGGPAFPVPETDNKGMTLRDHFAGLAMQGLLGTLDLNDSDPKDISQLAYILADCMINERNK
jgi:predicted nucleotidyltransferase